MDRLFAYRSADAVQGTRVALLANRGDDTRTSGDSTAPLSRFVGCVNCDPPRWIVRRGIRVVAADEKTAQADYGCPLRFSVRIPCAAAEIGQRSNTGRGCRFVCSATLTTARIGARSPGFR